MSILASGSAEPGSEGNPGTTSTTMRPSDQAQPAKMRMPAEPSVLPTGSRREPTSGPRLCFFTHALSADAPLDAAFAQRLLRLHLPPSQLHHVVWRTPLCGRPGPPLGSGRLHCERRHVVQRALASRAALATQPSLDSPTAPELHGGVPRLARGRHECGCHLRRRHPGPRSARPHASGFAPHCMLFGDSRLVSWGVC